MKTLLCRRKLGGVVPDSIEIRCPAIDARLNFPIPAIDLTTGLEGYKIFTRDRVIQNCRDQMSGIPEWDLLIESVLKTGAEGEEGTLELCWRTESKLDWAWLENDVDGAPRPWSVLFGVALLNVRLLSTPLCYLTISPCLSATLQFGPGTESSRAFPNEDRPGK
jgi:hypothetical protein